MHFLSFLSSIIHINNCRKLLKDKFNPNNEKNGKSLERDNTVKDLIILINVVKMLYGMYIIEQR